jgi:hypothetical protein
MLYESPTDSNTDVPVNPWMTIWTSPRETVRHVLSDNPAQWLWPLAFAGGLSRVLSRLAELPLPDALEADAVLLIALVFGPFAGLILVFGVGRLLHFVLRKLGGTATWIESRTAILWSLAPSVPSLALWLIMLAGYGPLVISPDAVENAVEPITKAILGFDYFVQFGLTLWMLALEVIMLAEVHRISAWRVLTGEIALGLALIGLLTLALAVV